MGVEPPQDLLCTTCWTVPACAHHPDPTQSTHPERSQPHHLCVLCARTWAPLHSRWSWLACPNCRAVNQAIRQAYGTFLPLGRHSIVNGAAVDLSEPDPRIRARQRARLEDVVQGMGSWRNWKRQQADRIQATRMPLEYRAAERIPTDVWVAHAQPSWEASCRSWLDYSDLADFEELHDRVLRIYSVGRLPWSAAIPVRGWEPERGSADADR